MATYRNWLEEIIRSRISGTPIYIGTRGGRKVYEVIFEDGSIKDYYIDFEAQTAEPADVEKITLRLDMAYKLAAKYHISPEEAHNIAELAEKYNLTFEDIVYIRDTINGTGAEEEA